MKTTTPIKQGTTKSVIKPDQPLRYPGSRPFKSDERALFKGRETEIQQLSNLVQLEKLVLLYSKSGLGKSSLINAGLLPRLDDKEYFPIKIRLIDASKSPEAVFIEALQPHFIESDLIDKKRMTIWDCVKAINHREAKTPVIILDQFEELFNYYTFDQRKKFTTQFADLVNDNIPGFIRQNIEDSLTEEEEDLSPELMSKIKLSEKPLRVKIIMAIRSDKLSHLEELSHKIPLILNNRYQLKPLGLDQARDAIESPALEAGTFRSPKFTFQSDIISRIIDFLSKEKKDKEYVDTNYVESFQLQILCQFIESELLKKIEQNSLTGTEPYLIDSTYIEDEYKMREVLENFYEREINVIVPEAERPIVQKLIETGLIIDGYRNSLSITKINKDYDISQNTLHALVDSHILRHERRLGQDHYEVSHDTLVGPILKAREKRKDQAIQQEVELLNSEKTILEKKNEQKNYYLWIAALALLFFAFLLYSWISSYNQLNEAKTELQRSKDNLENQIKETNRFKGLSAKERYLSRLTNLAIQKSAVDRTLAMRLAEMAWINNPESEVTNTTYNNLLNTVSLQPFYNQVFKLHTEAIRAVDISQKGWILTGSKDKKIGVWKSDNSPPVEFIHPGGQVFDVAFSPDSKKFASAGGNGVYLWDVSTGKNIYLTKSEFQISNPTAFCLIFSKDGQYIASGDAQGKVSIWDAKGNFIKEINLKGPGYSDYSIRGLSFFDNSTLLAATGTRGIISLIDWSKGNIYNSVRQKDEWGTSLTTLGDSIITVGFNTGVVKSWKINNGLDTMAFNRPLDYNNWQLLYSGNLHPDRITSIEYSADQEYLSTTSQDRKLRIWDRDFKLIKEMIGHEDQVMDASFHPLKSNIIVSSSEDKTVKKWIIDTYYHTSFDQHQASIRTVDFRPTKQQCASADKDGQVYLWDYEGKIIGKIDVEKQANDIKFGLNGDYLLIGTNSTLFRWDIKTNKLRSFSVDCAIQKLQIINDDSDILTVSCSKEARLWNYLKSEQTAVSFKGHNGIVQSVDYAKDKKLVVTGGDDGLAFLWDDQGNILDTIASHTDKISSVVFSPTGDYILSGSWDNNFKLWQVRPTEDSTSWQLQEINTFENHLSDIDALDFHPKNDSTLLILSASSDNSGSLWEFDLLTKNIKELPTIIRHQSSIRDAKFSPDGKLVLTASADNTANLWDIDIDYLNKLFSNVVPLNEEIETISDRLNKEVAFEKKE
jgi:WD40 repeat protein